MRALSGLFAGFFMLLLMAPGCIPEEDSVPALHDIALYSNATDLRGLYGYLYGEPTSLTISNQAVALTEGSSSDPLAVSTALLVNDQPYLKAALSKLSPPPTRVQRIPLTSDVQLEVGQGRNVKEVVYFDGRKWFTLAEEPAPTVARRIVPKERLGALNGLGQLTPAEADMLEVVLAERAPVAVTVLPETDVPTRRVEGVPDYRRTALYVQQTIPTDDSAYTPPAQELVWDVLAEGNQALGGEQESFELVTSEVQLADVWNRAYGSRLTPPPLPDVDFRRESILAVFLATKPTGGYGLEVQGVTLEDNDAYVDVLTTEPPADAITTQALTTPWVLVRVLRGGLGAAWFRAPGSEQLIGVARRTE